MGDDKLAIGSAVLADDRLQEQLSNKKMIVRRKSNKRLALYLIGRLFICFVSSVAAYGLINFLKLDKLNIYVSLIMLMVTLVGIYRFMWRDGHQDSTFVHFNNVPYDRLRGFKVGLIGSIPWIISTLVLWYARKVNSQAKYAVFRWMSMPFDFYVRLVTSTEFVADLTTTRTVLLSLIPVIIILTAIVGYFLGFQGRKLYQLSKNIQLLRRR